MGVVAAACLISHAHPEALNGSGESGRVYSFTSAAMPPT
jgi:hypothetical protein